MRGEVLVDRVKMAQLSDKDLDVSNLPRQRTKVLLYQQNFKDKFCRF